VLAFGVLVWLWNYQMLLLAARGVEISPLLVSVPFGAGRIAAYEIETAPAGAYISLRRQYRILPGVFLSREFSIVNSPVLDELTIFSPTQLCVAYPSLRTDIAGRTHEVRILIPIEPMLNGHTASLSEEDSTTVLSCSKRAN